MAGVQRGNTQVMPCLCGDVRSLHQLMVSGDMGIVGGKYMAQKSGADIQGVALGK